MDEEKSMFLGAVQMEAMVEMAVVWWYALILI